MLPDASAPQSLLLDLQQVNQIIQGFSGCLNASTIAKQITDELVQRFGCAFARIWLVEPDRTALRLVSSSGLYTHIDGSFARVPMGAFKVGKIAQNRVPFLSNQLPAEAWVKDRDWAIAQNITGFAGYPLAIGDRVVGVLALFSQQTLSPEFLEVLQWLCTAATIALDAALAHERALPSDPGKPLAMSLAMPLSDQFAGMLPDTRFLLVGTEQPLPASIHYLLLRCGEILSRSNCRQCRLLYDAAEVRLDAMVAPDPTVLKGLTLPDRVQQELQAWANDTFAELQQAIGSWGGGWSAFGTAQKTVQVRLALPYAVNRPDSPLSDREREIFYLLTQGLRDREIAEQLHISERTVKFHVNNTIAKLAAQTRYQALYQAIVRGWLSE